MMAILSIGRAALAGFLGLALWPAAAFAQSLPAASTSIIMTVTGLDPAVHPGGAVGFDVAMLEALGEKDIVTSSIWTEGTHVFTGVPLSALAAYLNLGQVTLSLHALNDYAVEIPLAEVEGEVPILAYEMDGQPMPVRDKGPIWVIYPYDDGPQYRTDTAYTRSIWQLDRIDVLR